MAKQTIVRVDSRRLGEVASLHCEELPDDFLSLLGKDFLQGCYYQELIRSPSSFILGVEEGKRLVGFAAFVGEEGLVGNVAKAHPRALISGMSKNALDLSFLRYLGVAISLSFLRRKKEVESGTELNYIAIRATHRGKGLGALLVKEGERIARKRKDKFLWVKTLKSTPENVRFYQKLGFKVHDESVGRVFLSKKLFSR